MAKLRKMLGDINDPSVVELMQIMETQSKTTLARWAIDYVKEHILRIYEKINSDDFRLRSAILASEEYLNGNKKLSEVKLVLKDIKIIPKELEEDPIAQAAARSIVTACGTIQTPTNALGFTFYSVAAIIYEKVGLFEKTETYDELARNEFVKILESFKGISIENEKNPAKINWNC